MVKIYVYLVVGLLHYCNFGQWTAEEDEQLKKNFAKIEGVCITFQ